MKISISGVCERDMDLFLIEELVADRDLLVWLLTRCNLVGEPDFDELAFTHSAVVGNGESDVEVRAKLMDGRSIVILIENKVDASFQPRQAERYRERAEDLCRNGLIHAAVTLLFAPSCYIGENSGNHGFDVTLTYEELRDWIAMRDRLLERAEDGIRLFSRLPRLIVRGVHFGGGEGSPPGGTASPPPPHSGSPATPDRTGITMSQTPMRPAHRLPLPLTPGFASRTRVHAGSFTTTPPTTIAARHAPPLPLRAYRHSEPNVNRITMTPFTK